MGRFATRIGRCRTGKCTLWPNRTNEQRRHALYLPRVRVPAGTVGSRGRDDTAAARVRPGGWSYPDSAAVRALSKLLRRVSPGRRRSRKLPPANAELPRPASRWATSTGPWDVDVRPVGGRAWTGTVCAALEDWSQHASPAVRHFSGYRHLSAFVRPSGRCAGPVTRSCGLDLGQVHSMARVRLNGRDLGVVWCAPWSVDISAGRSRAGQSAGDRRGQPVAQSADRRRRVCPSTNASRGRPGVPTGRPIPLLPSGLLGPLRLYREQASK